MPEEPLTPPAAAPVPPAPPPAPLFADRLAEVTRLQNEMANTRAEAAAHRIGEREAREQVTAANTRIAEIQAEAERRVVEATNASNTRVTTLQNRTIEAELKAAAIAAGLQDVDLMPLIDRKAITFDDAGNITGIPEAIASFKTSKPAYFAAAAAAAAPAPVRTASPIPAPVPNQAPPASTVRGMSREDYAAAKKADHNRLKRVG